MSVGKRVKGKEVAGGEGGDAERAGAWGGTGNGAARESVGGVEGEEGGGG